MKGKGEVIGLAIIWIATTAGAVSLGEPKIYAAAVVASLAYFIMCANRIT